MDKHVCSNSYCFYNFLYTCIVRFYCKIKAKSFRELGHIFPRKSIAQIPQYVIGSSIIRSIYVNPTIPILNLAPCSKGGPTVELLGFFWESRPVLGIP